MYGLGSHGVACVDNTQTGYCFLKIRTDQFKLQLHWNRSNHYTIFTGTEASNWKSGGCLCLLSVCLSVYHWMYWQLSINNFDTEEILKTGGFPGKFWSDNTQIDTDGSKNLDDGKAAIGLSIPQLQIQHGKRISNHVFTAELVAILWALGWVEEVRPGKLIICSDSAAALMALKDWEKLGQTRPNSRTFDCDKLSI